ncbi:PEP-CTERM sorting domain-containing protein [Tundrisphaera sp. TA3]|uniref:PEP-CTERM sorting domain-containing protein n=1 Tax=Tundrisphaera sp. TA3 TaxID=3435775 RepID=UPI003EBBD128
MTPQRWVMALTVLSMIAGAAGRSEAMFVTNGSVGLANPVRTITFSEVAGIQSRLVTDQFRSLGATFSGFYGDEGLIYLQNGIGFSGSALSTSTIDQAINPNLPGPYLITFTEPVNAAMFAAVDQGFSYRLDALLGGRVIETGTVVIPLLPGLGYIGFTGITFDAIRISRVDEARLSALAIDTLQFNPAVPEPSSLALCVIAGGVGLAARARRRRIS